MAVVWALLHVPELVERLRDYPALFRAAREGWNMTYARASAYAAGAAAAATSALMVGWELLK